MKIFIIILAILGLLISGISFLVRKSRANRIKHWKVGDKLILCNIWLQNELSKHNSEYAILTGWSMDSVIVSMGGNYVKRILHSDIDLNKSAHWRKLYSECENAMSEQKPKFSPEVGDSKTSNLKVDGKDIDLLNETELQVQLKIALDTEQYELATIIRTKLEKFR